MHNNLGMVTRTYIRPQIKIGKANLEKVRAHNSCPSWLKWKVRTITIKVQGRPLPILAIIITGFQQSSKDLRIYRCRTMVSRNSTALSRMGDIHRPKCTRLRVKGIFLWPLNKIGKSKVISALTPNHDLNQMAQLNPLQTEIKVRNQAAEARTWFNSNPSQNLLSIPNIKGLMEQSYLFSTQATRVFL